MLSEAAYQAKLIKKIERLLPDCLVLKNNPDDIQGIPDLLILNGRAWGMLEVKRSARDPFRPNQAYYLDLLDDMSFAGVIYPEIEEEVLDELQSALLS